MAIGSPVPRSVVVLTSAEPSSSVRSVARESAAMMVSALLTAVSAAFSAPSEAFSAPSVPHAVAVIIAAAVSPTQAAVYLSFMSPHPLPCSCDSSVRGTLPGTTDTVRPPDGATFFRPAPHGSRTPSRGPSGKGTDAFSGRRPGIGQRFP